MIDRVESMRPRALYGWTRDEAIGMRSHRLVPERNRQRHDDTLERLVGNQPHRDADDRRDLREPRDPRDRRDRVRPEREELTALHRDGHEFRVECRSRSTARATACASSRPCARATPEARADARSAGERVPSDPRSDRGRLRGGRPARQLSGSSTTRSAGCSASKRTGPRPRASSCSIPTADASASCARSTAGLPDRRAGRAVRIPGVATTADVVEQSVSLERDASGRPVGFLAIIRDCTARKQAEQERRGPRRPPRRRTAPRASSSPT